MQELIYLCEKSYFNSCVKVKITAIEVVMLTLSQEL